MDLDNIQQNMNTRVVFKEPRGMVRWLQLFFAIIAFSTVVDFYTIVGIDITCPSTSTTTTTVTPSPSSTSSLPPGQSSTTPPQPSPAPVVAPGVATIIHPKLIITYPFSFDNQEVKNTCPGNNYTYTHQSPLSGSPQFFVMTGVLSLLYASASLAIYLLWSSTYNSIPVIPVTDLIITGILCFFWFIASSSFSSGVSLLKSTVTYDTLKQVVCPNQFQMIDGVSCIEGDKASWKSLNVGLVSGFTSFFLWGAGMWFVYKETHFHQPRDQFGPT